MSMYKENATHRKFKEAYVVIGGGIAGVSCAQELALLCPTANVSIISESNTVVEASSVFRVTEHLEEVVVYERSTDNFQLANPRISIINGKVRGVDYTLQQVHYTDTEEAAATLCYDKLCICTGVYPRLIASNQNVIGLRDNHSVEDLLNRLKRARNVAVVGNGGIALELIHELTFCDVEWVIKNDYIGSAFFDASASAFIMPSLLLRANQDTTGEANNSAESKNRTDVGGGGGGSRIGGDLHAQNMLNRCKEASCDSIDTAGTAKVQSDASVSKVAGYGLGPEWIAKSNMQSFLKQQDTIKSGKLTIHYEQEIESLSSDAGCTWVPIEHMSSNVDKLPEPATPGCIVSSESSDTYPLYLRTTSDQVIGCDFVVSATGLQPNTALFTHSSGVPTDLSLHCDSEGYILVDTNMSTNIPNVYAAGDCCHYPDSLDAGASMHFFQMRLWTQARWMGMYAAQNMCGRAEEFGIDTKFELFSHITRFFGYKVVMLGRYNAQGLGDAVETLTKQIVVTADGLQRVEQGPIVSQHEHQNTASLHPETEIWVRVTPQREYIKLVVHRGKIVGALLIGDTDLEEVCENLILNALDVSGIGIELLNPDIDIADYFD